MKVGLVETNFKSKTAGQLLAICLSNCGGQPTTGCLLSDTASTLYQLTQQINGMKQMSKIYF